MDLVESTSRVGPTCCELDMAAFAEALEAGIAVDLNDAPEACQVRGGTLGLPIGTVEIDRCWWIGSVPGAVTGMAVNSNPSFLARASRSGMGSFP